MKVLLSFDQIQARIVEMGKQIAAEYAGRAGTFVAGRGVERAAREAASSSPPTLAAPGQQ